MTNQPHAEPQRAGTLESLSPSHTLRAVIHEIRAAERPPGEHIKFPEVAWPEPLQEAPAIHEPKDRTQRTRPREVPLVVEMIEPEHGRLTPWVFWALVALSFACALAKSAGWL